MINLGRFVTAVGAFPSVLKGFEGLGFFPLDPVGRFALQGGGGERSNPQPHIGRARVLEIGLM